MTTAQDQPHVVIVGKKIWIESDILGARHVMVQHDIQGERPFCYASFHYEYAHTSNSGTLSDAEEVARRLGATDPIEQRHRGWPEVKN